MSETPIDLESVTAIEIRDVDLDGQRLRAGIRRARDSTTPLLVFNGIGANLELVQPFVEALEGVEVVVFDVPGVGGSPAPTLPYRFTSLAWLADKLMKRLGYATQVDVLGVSWGGALAQQFAHQFSSRCRRLILASTSAGAIMVPGKLSVLSKLIPAKSRRRALWRRISAQSSLAPGTQSPHPSAARPRLFLPAVCRVGLDQPALARLAAAAHAGHAR